MKTVIEVKDLVKVYGKRSTAFEALKGINLEIYEGESVAIVGKSGSGKSTLMHLLALLDKPTSGSVIIDGVNSSKLRNRQLNKLRNSTFGFVFQQFFMNPQDTDRDRNSASVSLAPSLITLKFFLLMSLLAISTPPLATRLLNFYLT